MIQRPGSPMQFSFSFVKINVDAFLSLFSGLISVLTGLNSFRNKHLAIYKPILIGPESTDVIGRCTLFIFILGISCVLLSLWKLMSKNKVQFNQHVAVMVVILVGNFIIGIFLTDYRSKVVLGMDGEMRSQLKESVISRTKFGVGYGLSDSWDILQTKMSCCGVESYKDYMSFKGLSQDQAVPISCCVMKRDKEGQLQPENPSQCMMDAGRGVPDSIFLHAKGCHLPLSGWLLHHISKLTGLLFASILLQACSILYLSWQGYNKSSGSRDY